MIRTGVFHRRPKLAASTPVAVATAKVLAMTAELEATAERLRAAIKTQEGKPTNGR